MRLLSGKFKGRVIKTPKGSKTRPTTSKVRESIFNILQSELEGANFLDVFAGSGIMGIEAFSRGAKQVVFIEKDKRAALCIRENLKALHIEATVLQKDVFLALKQLAQKRQKFDIIYMDPPYAMEIDRIFEYLPPLLFPGGKLFIERGKGANIKIPQLDKEDLRHFGKIFIHLYKKPLTV